MISHKPDTWQTKGTQSKAFRSASLGEKNFPPSDMTGDADITMQRDWLEVRSGAQAQALSVIETSIGLHRKT